ncbi:multidrug effflux MFS transporter [Acinetobacter bereziniae]|uniref:multidrug effflux MFS transporter n=1 Tax=Acinetobacter bereziniae TaxID=106648 RepID=UPI00124F86AB|nr:multidrug effflux MFS transporter [Acinetobacter bereziniae]MBJ8444139.1 multidrug effflux MFS transporter [Acinetobacter bereziniae]MBJ9905049.1 multidrug effflux MFS transporter [Acinetobacter bereziniae]MCU4318625.1 multidrug effflux MFS transporter [Acinetobacter bereziniae]MCU4597443.1 multidrug effflux MFS transporter [Acinetobacter bereziniae]MDM1784558.1 multidrug effflux MFS transporter [Acinetobacter bereziniae]
MNLNLRHQKIGFALIVLLAMLTALDALAIDIYLPAFPEIAKSLSVNLNEMQQTLSIFLIGLAIGQGIYGPLLERFGRKLPLIIGVLIFIIGSLIASFASSLELLLTARFLQALGAAAGLVTPRAIISDLCNEQEAAKNFSILMQVMMVAPIVAPIVGSYLIQHNSWQIIFYTLAGLGTILLLWSIRSLPETCPPEKRQALAFKNILNNYRSLCSNHAYLYFTLASGFLFGGFFFYISNSPYIFLQHYQLNSSHFSYLFAFNAFCFIITGQISIWLLNQFWSAYKILKLGLGIFSLASIGLCLSSLFGQPTLIEYILTLGLAIWSTGFLFGNLTALAMQQAERHLTGVASSFMGLIQYALGAMIGFLASLMPEHISVLPLTLLLCGLLMFALSLYANKMSKYEKTT